MLRKERLKKCINILSLIYSEDKIMQMSPREIEEKTYEFLIKESELVKKYLEKVYESEKNKRVDRKVSSSEGV